MPSSQKKNNKLLSSVGDRKFLYGALLVLVGVGLGCGATVFVGRNASAQNTSSASIEELREKGYQFVSPLLAASPPEESAPITNAFEQSIFDDVNGPNVYSVSVYFQDLNSGTWVGINASDTYNPASLLKVPIMIAYFKEAEDEPGVLSAELPYRAEPADGTSTQFDTLTPGKEYSVDDLIRSMIVDSDNGAKYTLLQHIDTSFLLQTFADLGIQEPTVANYVISDRMYARFFKVLYNATYLDPDMSEKALELLSQATFKDGIVAGLPSNVAVAHKFGQYYGPSEDANVAEAWELGDCGIVYYPNDPYLLCVMTRGADLGSLEAVIQKASRIAYSEAGTQ